MKIKHVSIHLCQACLDGKGDECHTPGCALFLHDSPGHKIMPELYEVISEWEEGGGDSDANTERREESTVRTQAQGPRTETIQRRSLENMPIKMTEEQKQEQIRAFDASVATLKTDPADSSRAPLTGSAASGESDYIPYGDEWRREVMKLTKAQLVEILRSECIARREPQNVKAERQPEPREAS